MVSENETNELEQTVEVDDRVAAELSSGEALEPRDPVAAALAERDEYKDHLLRLRAEFDNYRKRTAREAERTRRMAGESLLRELLPVVDNLELALRHKDDDSGALAEGVEMVYKQFNDVLTRSGLEPIATVGREFDPNLHDAMLQQPYDDAPSNTIIQEFQRGYRIGDAVLRHAKVVVSTGTANELANNVERADAEQSSPSADAQE